MADKLAHYRLALTQRTNTFPSTVIISDVLNTVGTLERAGLTWTDELNGAGSLEFSLPIDHSDVTQANFAVGEREIYLYRTPSDGSEPETLVWGGKLWVADVQGWEVRFTALGFLHDLERRTVNADYAVVRDHRRIANDFVQFTQGNGGNPWTMPSAANMGVTTETISSDTNVVKYIVCVEERHTIRGAIDDLAAARFGFDYEITPSKVFKTYYPFRTRASTATFDGVENMDQFEYQIDAQEVYTDVAGVGPDDDCDVPVIYNTFDTASRTAYGVLEGTAEVESGTDTKHFDETKMEEITDEYLRIHKIPRYQPTLRLPTPLQEGAYAINWDDVIPGDTVGVNASRGPSGGFGHFSKSFRVVSRTVNVESPGLEYLTYGLDAPLPV